MLHPRAHVVFSENEGGSPAEVGARTGPQAAGLKGLHPLGWLFSKPAVWWFCPEHPKETEENKMNTSEGSLKALNSMIFLYACTFFPFVDLSI